jgi:hypothetical protein
LERYTEKPVVFSEMTVVVATPVPSEGQMGNRKSARASKRKSGTASKRARGPKITARAQRNKQAVVRSPKGHPLRLVAVAARSTETPLLHDESKQEAPIVEKPAAALNDFSQMMRANNPKEGIEFSLATENMQVYQAKLLEMAQANMQFAFEFGERLAMIRSPFEFSAVIAEFTNRRIDMFRKYSKMAVYPFWSIDGFRKLTALPGR